LSPKTLTILFLCLLLIFSGCALTPGRRLHPPVLARSYYTRGMRKLEERDLDGALADFKKARNADKNFAAAYVGMALVALEQGKCKTALRQIKQAKRKNNRCVEAYIAEGRILTRCRDRSDWLQRALKSYEMALKLAPQNDAAYFYQGETYKVAYQLSKAAQAYKQAVEKQGHFSSRAKCELKNLQKVLQAAPQTEVAMKIGLKHQITRADLAVLLLAELKLEERVAVGDNALKSHSTAVSDIAGHWAEDWIKVIIGLGLVGLEAFPDGTFKPNLPITRANFALVAQSVLYLLSNDPHLTTQYFGESSRFPDVRSNDYIYNAIALCVDKGIMQPQPDGNFRPAEYVTGADALLGINRLKDILLD